jgi:hypothetical protein
MENYSLEPVTQADLRQRRITRLLLYVWFALGVVVAGILCYVVSQAFRPLPVVPQLVGEMSEYPPNSANLEFINARFFDDTANKEFETIPLQVVRDEAGTITVFFARSTRSTEAALIPGSCVVEWNDSLSKFLELCGGSQWNRDGSYAAGPAPRNLDRFPARVEEGNVFIDLKLEKGALR